MEITPELIDQYKQGTCTPEQQKAVEAWLTAQEKIFRQETFPFPKEERFLGVEVWDRLAQNIGFENEIRPVHINKKSIVSTPLFRAASIILICSLSAALYWWRYSGKTSVFYSDNGKKTTYTLCDGSTITLNGGSSLYLNDDFNHLKREVTLSGEAFFDVKTDPSRPFIVKTESSTLLVLGTSFNLKAYPSEQQVLAVQSGRVQFALAKQKTAILQAGELLKEKEAKVVPTTQINDYLSWKEGCLLFEDQPLDIVAKTLERHYGIPVKSTIKQSNKIRLTGKFPNASFEEMLDNLSYTLNIHYKKEKDHVILF